MCPVAILGDRASGKTTFLGFLYATKIKYGTDHEDDFRFHAPPGSLRAMDDIYSRMREGFFPSATIKEQFTELTFLLGFRRDIVGKIDKKVKWIRDSELVNPFDILRFTAYDVSGEDVEEFIESGVAASRIIERLLRSNAIVIIIDCNKLTTEKDTENYKRMLAYDGAIARLLVNFGEYKAGEIRVKKKQKKKGAKHYRIFPSIVFAKFDTINEGVLHNLGLSKEYPSYKDREARKEFAETIFKAFMPQSLAQLRGLRLRGVNLDRRTYFFSHARIEKVEGMEAPDAKIVRTEFSSDGVGTPEFSHKEYENFIEHFRDISHKMPDDPVDYDRIDEIESLEG